MVVCFDGGGGLVESAGVGECLRVVVEGWGRRGARAVRGWCCCGEGWGVGSVYNGREAIGLAEWEWQTKWLWVLLIHLCCDCVDCDCGGFVPCGHPEPQQRTATRKGSRCCRVSLEILSVPACCLARLCFLELVLTE